VLGQHFQILRLADSWLVAIHKNTYAVSRSRGLPSANIFQTGVFKCGHPHFLLQKPTSNFSKFINYSVSTSDMDRGEGREREWVSAYIFWQGEVNLWFCVDVLWNSKVKHGLYVYQQQQLPVYHKLFDKSLYNR